MNEYVTDSVYFFNCDCMEYMKQFPDGYFDLAVVDPPYGGGGNESVDAGKRFGQRFERYAQESQEINVELTGGTWASKYEKSIASWDVAPPPEYFDELFRVSKNQIIWGGNYFELPATRCFLIWEKLTISEGFTMAMAEYAWTSFNDNAKIFKAAPQGKASDPRFHPTQKPVELYDWIFSKYAEPGMKILDTHAGSGSSIIAAENRGLEIHACEINKKYFEKAVKRIERETAQITLFNL